MTHINPKCCCDENETECPIHGNEPPTVTCSRSGLTFTYSIVGAATARLNNAGVETDLTPLLNSSGDYSGTATAPGEFTTQCVTATNGCGTRTCCASWCNCPPHLPEHPDKFLNLCNAFVADYTPGGTMPNVEVTITGGATAAYFDPMEEPPLQTKDCCPFEGSYIVPCGPRATASGQFFPTFGIAGGTDLPDVYRACFVKLGPVFFVPGQGAFQEWGWQVLHISRSGYLPAGTVFTLGNNWISVNVRIAGGSLSAPVASFNPTDGQIYDETDVPTVLMGWLPAGTGGFGPFDDRVFYLSGWSGTWAGTLWKAYDKIPTSTCRAECNETGARPSQASRYNLLLGDPTEGSHSVINWNGISEPGGCKWFTPVYGEFTTDEDSSIDVAIAIVDP